MISQKQLAHALALFRFGNFSRAARESNISQPAFSRSIQALEKELDVKLFDRDGHKIIPTQYGESLLRHAKEIIDESEELKREIKLMQGLGAGRFGVALGMYPAELSGNRAIGEMAHKYPELRFSLALSDWWNVTSHVLSRSVDLGFAEISVAKNDDRLDTELIGQHNLVLYCRAGHPLANHKKVTHKDLNQYPLVTVRLPKRLITFPGKSDIDEISGHLIPSIEVANLATAREIIASSNAIGPTTPLQIENELKSGKYRVLPIWGNWLKLDYGFILLRGRSISPATENFMNLIRDIESDIQPRNRRMAEEILSGLGISMR